MRPFFGGCVVGCVLLLLSPRRRRRPTKRKLLSRFFFFFFPLLLLLFLQILEEDHCRGLMTVLECCERGIPSKKRGFLLLPGYLYPETFVRGEAQAGEKLELKVKVKGEGDRGEVLKLLYSMIVLVHLQYSTK